MTRRPLFITIFSSRYCQLVFFISLWFAYLLIPAQIWHSSHFFLVGIFILTFAIATTCAVRGIKEKILSHRAQRGSVLSLIGGIIGVAAVQACGLHGPLCIAGVGLGLFSAFLPVGFLRIFAEYSSWLLYGAVAMQFFAIIHMKCFTSQEMTCQR